MLQRLRPFFPVLETLQSLNLRAALFRWLSELKKNEALGKEIIIRKAMFDDCKGEKLQELLASFSTLVLRKMLVGGQDGRSSIAGRLAVAKKVTAQKHASLLPLAVAHRASLTVLLRRKQHLRQRYHNFSKVLDLKEQELDSRFEAIVKIQEFLDINPIPDHTVSRVSKLFEKNWHGDCGLVRVVTEGEDQISEDGFLDKDFTVIWPKISDDSLDESTERTSNSLLEDLEKRVADQEARLGQWKDFKDVMEKNIKSSANPKPQSPALARVKSSAPDIQQQRDLVFSPRKSPRKSGWGVRNDKNRASFSMPAASMNNDRMDSLSPSERRRGNPANKTSKFTDHKYKNGLYPASGSPHDSSLEETDRSGFSEVTKDEFQCDDLVKRTARTQNLPGPPDGGLNNARADMDDDTTEFANLDEDDLLADQIVSMTLNAAPTPAKPKLSLIERTRQSILASSSPQKLISEDDTPPPQSLPAIKENKDSPIINNSYPPKNLLDRTRQSISLVPSKPRGPRQSIHNLDRRRTSKIYPTNQFETPRKQMERSREFTPPEELFSPRAGYDSVFKSRPKVGFSPITSPATGTSPTPDDEVRFGNGEDDQSPLAKVTARA